MLKRLLPLCFLLVAALPAQRAAAQVNYKSTMPDGKVIYGDKPAPGATKVDKLKAPTTQGITGPTTKEGAVLKDLEKDRVARDARESRLRAARDKVKQAEAALAAGKEPREGERIGTANGKSRLADSYLDRQKQLEQDLARARAELASIEAAPATASSSTARKGGVNQSDVLRSGIDPRAAGDR